MSAPRTTARCYRGHTASRLMRTMHSIPQIEPGPASHDQARRDGTHLVSCRDRGVRGTINAVSSVSNGARSKDAGGFELRNYWRDIVGEQISVSPVRHCAVAPHFRGDVGPCFSAIGITGRGPHRRATACPPPSSGATAPVASFSAWILRYEPQRSLPKSRLGRVSGDPARAPVLTL
jgi:hypothetical protein